VGYIPSLFLLIHLLLKLMKTRYEVRYQTPYNQCEWRSQWFNTLAEAERMVEFYLSCGSKSYIAP